MRPLRSTQLTSTRMPTWISRASPVRLGTSTRLVSATMRPVSTLSAFGSPTTLYGVLVSISLTTASVSRSPRLRRKLFDWNIGT